MAGEMMQLARTKLGRAIISNDIAETKECLRDGENPRNHDRDGNTALHVAALHDEAGHVADLMMCNIDYHLKNNDGKEAYQLVTVSKHWMDIFNKFQPALRQTIASHDIDRVQYLFGCWCSVEQVSYGKNIRQFAAYKTHHDIVAMVDKVKMSLQAVYAVLQSNYEKLEYALKRTSCDVNYLQRINGCHPRHLLQHAMAQNDPVLVNMLLKANSDVNTPVQIKGYIKGPLYFEAISCSESLDKGILQDVAMNENCDLTLKDERGRTALMYTIDKTSGQNTLDLIECFLSRGIDIAQRDDTGCTARDTAVFARRKDIIKRIDQYVVDLMEDSNMDKLRYLTMNSYEPFFFEHMSRDTWIYAAGNETDGVTNFLNELPKLKEAIRDFHYAVKQGNIEKLENMLEKSNEKAALLRSTDKAGRGPLTKAILFGHFGTAKWLLTQDDVLPYLEKDNLYRNPLHYLVMYEDNEDALNLKDLLIQNSSLGECRDCKGFTANEFCLHNRSLGIDFIETERKAIYGMELEIDCLHKYETLLRIIRSDGKKLRDFDKVLKTIKRPLKDFPKLLSNEGLPLVPTYRDLLLAAIDHGKLEIAEKLVKIGVDCKRKEKYKDKEGDEVHMDAFDRCERKGYHELLSVMRKCFPN